MSLYDDFLVGDKTLLRERVRAGKILRVYDARVKASCERVQSAEMWLRDLSTFFVGGEIHENLRVILAELERLRQQVARLEERRP